jgi:acyl dehydratase
MSDFYVKVGDSVSFSKTVSESDVYGFAGITGDFSGNHVDEEFMKKSAYGRRIAHGALMVGFMSTCSTKMIEQCNGTEGGETPVSAGYDRIRMRAGVPFGDTVFRTVITQTINFPETSVAGTPINEYAPSSNGAQAYRSLASELVFREESSTTEPATS